MHIGGRTWIGAGLAAGLLLGVAGSAGARQDDPARAPAARGVTQILTAAELADWGRDRGALIMAARLLAEVPLRHAGGGGRPGGEGLSGLARAFFFAGARSVMASHWEVSDAATTTLITAAFAGLDGPRARDPGVRARALQAGIRAVRAERRWAHPAYWAAFTLVGEPG